MHAKQLEKLESAAIAALNTIAKARRPRVARWYGARGGASRRVYVCYVCDAVIDTESAQYPRTRHACAAIDAHYAAHCDDLGIPLGRPAAGGAS